MNKLVKKIGSLALVSTLVLGTNLTQAYASNRTVDVAIDGRIQVFPDVEPYIDNNARTQVPIRFVSEKLGADVNWNGSTQTAIIKKDGKTVEMAIGQNKLVVDGVTKVMDTSPTLYQGRTVVPLRYVSEGLGVGVDFDSTKNLVNITTDNNGTLPEPTLDMTKLGDKAKEGYGISYDSIEFPVKWAETYNPSGKGTIDGIIYDITLKNGNEVWVTTNQYMGSINVANEPVIKYASILFYNSKTGDSFNMTSPKGITSKQNSPEITYNADGTITYMLETYESDGYSNNDFIDYSKYDRIRLGTKYGKINIPVSSLIK